MDAKRSSGGMFPVMGARYFAHSSACAPESGASDMPQLPFTSVVRPWQSSASPKPSRNSAASAWRCMSIKPGVRTRPAASMVSNACAFDKSPTSSIMPSKMPTSAVNAAFPVPSTIFAPRINVSSMYITSFLQSTTPHARLARSFPLAICRAAGYTGENAKKERFDE